jgi:CDP-diacylglycerol--glycerol-3-phosphate 3-phosphatidyltransferase/CDP-diacylglycerol--inositol 3-phosphatidyltransferase
MLERFRQFWTNLWAPVANLLIRLGVTPNQVTFVSTLGVVVGALFFFPRGQLLVGVLFITAFVFGDLIDGYMARTTGTTSKWGAFFDSTMDRFGDAAIFGGLLFYYLRDDAATMLGEPRIYVVLCLLCLVSGNLTSYARARAESLGYTAKVGIAERADRLVFVLVATGFNGIFGLPILTEVVLWFLTVAGFVTVLMRMATVHRQATASP